MLSVADVQTSEPFLTPSPMRRIHSLSNCLNFTFETCAGASLVVQAPVGPSASAGVVGLMPGSGRLPLPWSATTTEPARYSLCSVAREAPAVRSLCTSARE